MSSELCYLGKFFNGDDRFFSIQLLIERLTPPGGVPDISLGGEVI